MKAPITLLLLLIYFLGFGQVPSLSVDEADWAKELEIREMSVEVEIVGNIATTTFDMVFYNPNRRDLEGELAMPLSEGQEICRYALDVNGTLREGVLVEKVKARQAFEAVVRQNIDPGIVNLTKGNFFKTRIYPIPRRGQKRVVLALSETLTGDEDNLYYALPMEQPKPIGTFRLEVRVIKGESNSKPLLGEFDNASFDHRNDAQVLSLEREDFTMKEPLKFTIPRFGGTDHQLFTCEWAGETYFYLNARAPQLSEVERKQPETVAIYWDRSSSGTKRNLEKELGLLEDYLNALPTLKRITLTAFGTTIDPAVSFEGDVSKLLKYLRGLRYDGATRLDQLSFDARADEIWLFTDGINTIGADEVYLPEVPIQTIASSSGSNYGFLHKVAGKTRGTFVNLAAMTRKKALDLLQSNQEQFLSVSYDRSELQEVYPNLPQRIGPNIEIAGILNSDQANLTINYGTGGEVTKSQHFLIKKATQARVARVWASKKIAALNYDYERNKTAIQALGQAHKIVTKNTSFIVLDRVEDYVEHEIVPPMELRQEYDRLMAQKKKALIDPEGTRKANKQKMILLKEWYMNPPVIVEKRDESTGSALRMSAVPQQDEIDEDYFDGEAVIEELVVEEAEFSELQGQVAGVSLNDSWTPQNTSEGLSGSNPSIKVLAWLPDAPYLEVLRKTNADALEEVYFEQRKEHATRPAFFIQVADFFYENNMRTLASRILSNTIELDLENPELLRVVAKRFQEEGELEMSIALFQEIRDLRPEEPQSYRDLALVYEENGQYQEALDLYQHIMDQEWPRFEEIKHVILNEMNRLIAVHRDQLKLREVPKELVYEMPLDVRIVIDWSSNDSDIDLWVIDPNGEKCFYGHQNTRMGGKISTDFTQGYGPEEFSLKEAERGFYTVYVNYFSESRQTITGPVTIYATLYTKYGTPEQQMERVAVQVTDNKESRQIAQLEFGGK